MKAALWQALDQTTTRPQGFAPPGGEEAAQGIARCSGGEIVLSAREGAWASTRRRVYELLEPARPGDRTSRATDLFVLGLILANVAAVVVGSVESVRQSYGSALVAFEYVSIAVFTVEYLLRLWSVAESNPERSPLRVRARYAVSWLAIVDLLAILPAFLPMLLPIDLRMLRLFRLFMLARILKVGRHSRAVRTSGFVLRDKREELVIAMVTVLVLLLVSSSLMYAAEKEAQPEAFSGIPAAMWWGAAALTTVGYGDVYPITALGKLLGVISAVLGIGMFALPAGILASGFSEALSRERSREGTCPTCGSNLGQAPRAATALQDHERNGGARP
jgi:voltage-gated potassium channel